VTTRAAAPSRALRRLLFAGCALAVLYAAWGAPWRTEFRSGEREVHRLHPVPAPMWWPPDPIEFGDALGSFPPVSEWHRVDRATVVARAVPNWRLWLESVLLLLIPALLLPGAIQARRPAVERDVVVRVGFRAGLGLTLGALTSFASWLVFRGWAPAAFVELALLGLVLGAAGALPAKARVASPR